MATQTGSYDFKAAKQAKLSAEATAAADATTKANDAKKVATNFIATDSSGMMVYDGSSGTHTPTNPGSTTSNVLIDSNSVDIRQGTDVLATFGSTTRVGKQNEANVVIDSTGMSVNTPNLSNAVRVTARDVGGEGYGSIHFAGSSFAGLSGYVDSGAQSTFVEAHSNDADNPGIAQLMAEDATNDTMGYVTANSSGGVELSAQSMGTTEASSFIIMGPDSIHADSENITVHGDTTIVSYQSGVHSFLYAEKEGTSARVAFGIGNSGGRHGIYSDSQGMWIIMCDESTGDIYIGGASASNKITGWVTESDTNNDWTYRKYSDGTFDAWGTFTVTPTSSTASGNIYYSNSISVNMPFSVSSGTGIATGSVGSQYAWLVNTSVGTATVSFRIARGAAISTSTALSVRLHVFGEY